MNGYKDNEAVEVSTAFQFLAMDFSTDGSHYHLANDIDFGSIVADKLHKYIFII